MSATAKNNQKQGQQRAAKAAKQLAVLTVGAEEDAEAWGARELSSEVLEVLQGGDEDMDEGGELGWLQTVEQTQEAGSVEADVLDALYGGYAEPVLEER